MFLLIGAVSQGTGFEVKMLLVYFACLFLMWCFLFFGTPEKDRSCVTHCYEIQIWKFKPQGGSSTKKSGKSKTRKYLTLTNSLTDRVSGQCSLCSTAMLLVIVPLWALLAVTEQVRQPRHRTTVVFSKAKNLWTLVVYRFFFFSHLQLKAACVSGPILKDHFLSINSTWWRPQRLNATVRCP